MSELSKLKQRIRNLETTYNNQKNRSLRFEKLYKEEKQKNLEKDKLIEKLRQEQETNKQTIEEYLRMIFHKKFKNKSNCSDCSSDSKSNWNCNDKEWNKKNWNNNENEWKNKPKRDSESYQKPEPKEEEVTDKFEYKIGNCFECWEKLIDLKKYIRFIEDIDAAFILERSIKTITKEIIWSWYCKKCRKYRSKKPISKIPIVFWENIRMFINFQITIMKMEYSITQKFLEIVYGIQISEWEIRNILAKEALLLNPEYERIRKRITSQLWVHFDETSWIVQKNKESKYAWMMTWTETKDALFEIWISRWGWAVKLLAQNIKENEDDKKNKTQDDKITKFVWISDWYWWYTNKFEKHWLCWAHPNRKLRDLSESKSLDNEKLERCKITYDEFSKLYSKVRHEIKKEYMRIKKEKPSNKEKLEKLKNRLINKLIKITKIHKNDPKKLVTYKKTITKYIEKYFVCILIPWIPADNNKAERGLRHLVLKRRTSHWSISNESARFMSVNYSVLLSLYWKSYRHFFEKYKRIRDASLIWIEPEE